MDRQIILGESLLLTQALDHLSHIAPLDKPVLIVGERGTGKELIAERLHFLSRRWEKPYLKINCAALSDSLLESTLFGHEVGAFTGAVKASKGYFERANEGTLFLDELGTISTRVQEKLLRVIEYGEFERLGGQNTLQSDVRIIGATNADLVEMAQNGNFRADLLDRLAFDVINLPPLRYRPEDILILAEHFAIAMIRELDREMFMGFSPKAMQTLSKHDWPGNIRELKNAVQRSVYRQQDALAVVDNIVLNPFITDWEPTTKDIENNTDSPNQLPSTFLTHTAVTRSLETNPAPSPINLKKQIADFECQLIKSHLIEHHYHQKNTAQSLGISYHQIRVYLKKYPFLLNK